MTYNRIYIFDSFFKRTKQRGRKREKTSFGVVVSSEAIFLLSVYINSLYSTIHTTLLHHISKQYSFKMNICRILNIPSLSLFGNMLLFAGFCPFIKWKSLLILSFVLCAYSAITTKCNKNK